MHKQVTHQCYQEPFCVAYFAVDIFKLVWGNLKEITNNIELKFENFENVISLKKIQRGDITESMHFMLYVAGDLQKQQPMYNVHTYYIVPSIYLYLHRYMLKS